MSRYLRLLAVFVALLCAALAGFNAFIDPYGYFNPPNLSGVNELPLGFNHRPLLAKSLAVSELRPATIILGNSRAEAAYDPQHPAITLQPAHPQLATLMIRLRVAATMLWRLVRVGAYSGD